MAQHTPIGDRPSSHPENEKSARFYKGDCQDQVNMGRVLVKKRNIPKGARVLDIGCGPGNLTVEIADGVGPSGSVVGVDLSEARINIARKTFTNPALDTFRPNLSFLAGDAHNLEFPDNHFDFVVANAVIHFLDLRKSLVEINRVLKPGGGFAACTAAGEYLFAPIEIKKEVQSREQYRAAHIDPNLGVFAFPKQSHFEDVLVETGYHSTEIDVIHGIIVREDPKAMINFLDASWSETYIRCIPEKLQATAWDDFEKEFEKLRTERGIEIDLAWMNVYTTKAPADNHPSD
ncbi:hypothetical protein SEPCBS119000_000410 [Sporothrix epigloea]|uniref:Methyltransferase domain-containing protein n=1 Tax=Sporothrix epigloea TaxID=1892477 RepID=A0ABP0D521_9PEZI